MSHDTEAAYASSEVADLIMTNRASFFGSMGTGGACYRTRSVFCLY